MKKTNSRAKSRPHSKLSKAVAELQAIYGPDYVIKIEKRRGRGRPKKVPITQTGLVLSLDEMMEIYRQRGLTEREARRHAFADMLKALATEDSNGHPLPDGKVRRFNAATLERFYRAGVRELRESEMWLALEIDKIIAKQGRDAVPQYDPCGTGGVTWLRYKRGKRALKAARRKQEK